MTPQEQAIVHQFHELYYDGPERQGPIQTRTFWRGVECLKCPLDLWIYQEIIHEISPDLIVETGTHMGGSALFLAHMLDIGGKGELVSVDIRPLQGRPSHPRIRYVSGSSADLPSWRHSSRTARPMSADWLFWTLTIAETMCWQSCASWPPISARGTI